MRQIQIELKNCFGIKEMSRTLDFVGGRNTQVIYAPNGVMKTSLANVLRFISGQSLEEAKEALQDEDSVFLYELYHRNKMIKRNGMEVIDVRWEQKQGIIRLVNQLQQNMQKMIMEKGIAIESNPTSNYKIGRFERYDELPLLQFKPINVTGIGIRTSINTDDRGVFATSIAREYSLIGLALRNRETARGRRVYSDSDIVTYLNDLRENGEKMCFK